MFADILTIKEAVEFDNLVKTEKDFFLTSCCCPVWFNMVKRIILRCTNTCLLQFHL